MHNSRIIPKKILPVETHWQKELANSFTRLETLLDYLQVSPPADAGGLEEHSQARKLFAMRVPRPFADLMESGNWHDPLLQQVLPQQAEFVQKDGFVSDPLQEQNSKHSGLIHKYQSRVLLIVRGGCAVNCRYCFRRHFPYQDNHLSSSQYSQTIAYIAKDKSLNEVILSGGDPLMAKDYQLAELAEQISHIDHIKRLRIHTRLPVVIPSRINDEFIAWISNLSIKPILVLHINHANEIGTELIQKCEILRAAGVTLLNQSVLLKGINDTVEQLENLSEKLFSAGILPYYLHILDPVKGASHFEVDKQLSIQLLRELIKRLPGFLVPKLVQELPGQPGKTPIDLGLEP